MPDRKEYAQCVGAGLRGKKLSGPERREEFCILSKTCSGKAPDREHALAMCAQGASEKAARPGAPRGRKGSACSGRKMRLVLLTTTNCEPCSAASQYLKKYVDTGQIEVLDIQKSDEGADLVQQHGLTSLPRLLILDADGQPFSQIQVTDKEQTI